MINLNNIIQDFIKKIVIEIKKEDIISAFEEYKKGKTIGAYEFSVNNFLKLSIMFLISLLMIFCFFSI